MGRPGNAQAVACLALGNVILSGCNSPVQKFFTLHTVFLGSDTPATIFSLHVLVRLLFEDSYMYIYYLRAHPHTPTYTHTHTRTHAHTHTRTRTRTRTRAHAHAHTHTHTQCTTGAANGTSMCNQTTSQESPFWQTSAVSVSTPACLPLLPPPSWLRLMPRGQ